MMSECEITEEEWEAMKTPRLEPGTGSENIAIIEHQCLNSQFENAIVVTPRLTPREPAVENSGDVDTPRLTPRELSEDDMQSKNKGRIIMAFFQRSWQAIKQGFTRCMARWCWRSGYMSLVCESPGVESTARNQCVPEQDTEPLVAPEACNL